MKLKTKLFLDMTFTKTVISYCGLFRKNIIIECVRKSEANELDNPTCRI